MRARFPISLTVIALSLLGAGCGGKDKLVELEGIVTMDGGKPLAGATVQFIPVDAGGRPASGLTGDDGSFRLTTYSTGDGVKPGDYKVKITMTEVAGNSGVTPVSGDPKSMIEAMKGHAKKNPRPNLTGSKKGGIHPNYSDETKTPLRQRVPPEGPVQIKLNSNGS